MATARASTRAAKLDITPEVTIYDLFKHLNYAPWYALAEFGDNALQSFLTFRRPLERVEGKGFQLTVNIDYDGPGRQLVIRDNAAGIAEEDYARAFKTGRRPPETEAGLSQFGVGLKSAASWFAATWSVRSKALGEAVEREVIFDVPKIVGDNVDHLTWTETPRDPDEHYTVVTLRRLHAQLQPRTVTKIKEHLGSIYRKFIRDGDLEILFGGEKLGYTPPEVLEAPPYDDADGPSKVWRKPINIAIGRDFRAKGEAYLRKKGSVSQAGFALFRNRRLIYGSQDETYRPPIIFERANSFIYQRLAGELDIEGLDVTHTKDGFRWEGLEDEFLEKLKEQLNEPPVALLDQAREHRARPRSADVQRDAERALDSTAKVLEKYAQEVLASHMADAAEETRRAEPPHKLERASSAAKREIRLAFDDITWTCHLDLTVDPAVTDWYSIWQRPSPPEGKERSIGVRVALDHKFMSQFALPDNEHIEPLVRIAVAMALAETTAREARIRDPGEIRIIVNDLLRRALWNPR